MKNILMRAISLLLTLLLVGSVLPVAFAEGTGSSEVDKVMELFDERVKAPKADSLLGEPETMEVWSKYGRLIYVYSRPAEALDFKLAEAKEGTKVTVYAKQNGFALAKVEGSEDGGWMRLDSLDTKLHSEHPSFLDIPYTVVEGTYIPRRGEYLDDYQTKYVKSTYGTRICIIDDPRKPLEEQKVIGYANEAEACTVLCAKYGKLFVVTENNRVGWVSEKLMVDSYK